MSAHIDVLAVLDAEIACKRIAVANGYSSEEVLNETEETRAAVAELIERDRVATEIFTRILRGVNDLDGPMGHRSEQYVAGWLGQWAKSMHAAGFKPLNPESRDITSALANVGGAK
jgi:hypothetical protein